MNQAFIQRTVVLLLASQTLWGCGQSGEQAAVQIQVAKPSPLATKIRECSAAKLSAKPIAFKAKTEVLACRQGADGAPVDIGLRPAFLIGIDTAGEAEKSVRRIHLRQNIAFFYPDNESVKETESAAATADSAAASETEAKSAPDVVLAAAPDAASDTASEAAPVAEDAAKDAAVASVKRTGQVKTPAKVERLKQDGLVSEILNSQCAPVVQQVLDRSGLKATIAFRALRDGDRLDNALQDTLAIRFDRVKGISIYDEVAPIWSGLKNDVAAPFCAQLTIRVLEGLGIVAGRNCACRLGQESCQSQNDADVSAEKSAEKSQVDKSTADTTTADKTATRSAAKAARRAKDSSRIGVMKQTDPLVIAKSGRLNVSEIKQLLEPVCGSLDTPAPAAPATPAK